MNRRFNLTPIRKRRLPEDAAVFKQFSRDTKGISIRRRDGEILLPFPLTE